MLSKYLLDEKPNKKEIQSKQNEDKVEIMDPLFKKQEIENRRPCRFPLRQSGAGQKSHCQYGRLGEP